MKAIKFNADDIVSFWEDLEEIIPEEAHDKVAKKYIEKLVELKADYQLLDSIRNYNNTLDIFLEDALMNMQPTKRRSNSNYNSYDDEEDDYDEYDY